MSDSTVLRCEWFNIAVVGVCVGLLRTFFDILLDEDVVQEKVFFQWESSAETEIKTSLGSFFSSVKKAAQMVGQ